MNYIVVPDGVKANNNGELMSEPSFVFKQVLDYVMKIFNTDDNVFLAPANNFRGEKYEQEIAYDYLLESWLLNNKGKELINVQYPIIKNIRYIDTYGNALYLKEFLGSKINQLSFDLVCSKIHSYRAEYCFKKLGYRINRVHRVEYEILSDNVVKRLWYYKYRPVHFIYEILAYIKDIITIPFRSFMFK